VEYGTKMISSGPIGHTGSIKYMLQQELAKDPYGIGWTGIPHAADVPQVKALAIAAEFMRFVLSRQGQEDVARLGSYLPLAPAFAREQPEETRLRGGVQGRRITY
jgi:ABC-type thiamine transport system substrate-binding protein